MELVERALKKVKRVLGLTSLLYNIINTAIVFLVCSLVLAFFALPLVYAFIPGGIAFVYFTQRRKKMFGFGDVEKKIPELEWRLRTSADNKYRHDALASSLHRDVMQKIGLVKVSKFFSSKHVLYKFATVIGLIILLSVVQVNEVTLANVKPVVKDNKLTGFFQKENLSLDSFFGGEEADEDLYGDPSIAPYGSKEELLELQQTGGLVDSSKAGNDKGKTFNKDSSAEENNEVFGGETSKEKIRDKDRELIKKYFDGINRQE